LYYQDRLGGRGFTRILLGGLGKAPGAVDMARRNLEEHMGASVEPIDPTAAPHSQTAFNPRRN
jgi:hypothetical protein